MKQFRDSEGRFHREDGPAVEHTSGAKLWYRHGVLHRTDGPAVELKDGLTEWWENGNFIRGMTK